jgi:DNA repair photolyase
MILSVSRRTDIPAFYSDWFLNRISEGYAYVINPFNRKQVSKILLTPEVVDCIVFWTKNPKAMMSRLKGLQEYNYYFQFTLTSYRLDIEENMPPKKEVIETFKALSEAIGKDRVVWRYDPILLNSYYTKEYHFQWFEKFMQELSPYTERCVISFLDFYKKTERNMEHLNIKPFEEQDIFEIAQRFSKVSDKYGVTLEACAEKIDLTGLGIKRGSCIDGNLIARLIGKDINIKKDDTQREECGCAKSVDIGQYNTCNHRCTYCYANYNHEKAAETYQKHMSSSSLITGSLIGDEAITERKMKPLVEDKFDKST